MSTKKNTDEIFVGVFFLNGTILNCGENNHPNRERYQATQRGDRHTSGRKLRIGMVEFR